MFFAAKSARYVPPLNDQERAFLSFQLLFFRNAHHLIANGSRCWERISEVAKLKRFLKLFSTFQLVRVHFGMAEYEMQWSLFLSWTVYLCYSATGRYRNKEGKGRQIEESGIKQENLGNPIEGVVFETPNISHFHLSSSQLHIEYSLLGNKVGTWTKEKWKKNTNRIWKMEITITPTHSIHFSSLPYPT